MFKIGQMVVWADNGKLLRGHVDKINKDAVHLVGGDKDSWYYAAFMYPDTPECAEFLEAGIALTKRHQEEQDQRMKETYQFNNQLVRDGLK